MSDFAYFQEQDSEQFSFFRIPKILFSDERFRNLSSEAKILYGLMLDRVGLSRKNGWVDAEGNVYIHFTIEEMMSVLKWSRYRIFQLLDELDEKEPGIGLIERRRVGHCKPNVIYVKNFASVNRRKGSPDRIRGEPEAQKSEVRSTDLIKYDMSDFMKSVSQTSGSMPAGLHEVCQSDSNNTDKSNIDNQMETSNPGYDRYRYNVDEIGHDPFILISYLSAKYEVFEFDSQIKADLDALFAAQYGLTSESSTETITEKKTVRVGESLGQVVTSGYCPCAICCGVWAGGPTASGVYPQSKHTIAVDAYTPKLPLGTKVVMNGVEYTVEDTGEFTRYGVDFDVYYDTHAEAEAHGHQTWEAYLADDNGSNQVEVVTTSTESVYSVTLTNRSLTGICQNRLNTQQKALFSAYNETKGNLQMFESPLDFNWHYRISSYYGYRIHPISGLNAMHNGIDISAAEGTSIEAGLTGTVKVSGYDSGYGNYVVLTDEDGYEITYAHLSSRSVSAGEQIEKGTEIGKVGSTGNSTGPHLHLELSHNGEHLNPVFYFETGDSMPNGNVEYSSEAAKRLVEYALQFQGVPYVWGGYSPAGFDCSGFVSYCLTNSGVLNTGHMDCNGLLGMMTVIPESEMQPGDIIFFQGTYATEGASHVGIYIGNGQMVHSGNPNKISDIYNPYYQQHWMCVARW